MNNKAQTAGVLIMVFIALIVGLSLLAGPSGIAGEAARMTTLMEARNTTATLPASLTGRVDLIGQKATNMIVTNATSGVKLLADNYTIYNNILLADGTLGSRIGNGGGVSVWNNTIVNLTYTYEPLGYAADTTVRTIIRLIVIFASLVLVAVAISPVLRGTLMDAIGK